MARRLPRLLDPGDWLAVKPQLDPKATALEINYKPGAAEYKLRIWVGLAVLSIASAVVYFSQDGVLTFVAGGFGFFGLLNLVYGLRQSRFSMWLVITASEVAVDRQTLLGRRRWQAWLRDYRGVLLRERQLREDSVDSMAWEQSYHIIELVHDDDARTVPLYVKEGGPPPREIQEAFARRFSLPALSPDSSGEAVRAARELDRSLSEAGAPVADPGPAPSGVLVQQQDGATRLTIGIGRGGKSLVWLFWLSLPPLFGGLVYQLDPAMGFLTTGMVAFGVLVLLGIEKLMGGKQRLSRRAVCIDSERVWIDEGAPPPARSLPRSRIEQVRVDLYTSHSSQLGDLRDGPYVPTHHPRLVIEGDTGRLEYIGAQFDRKKLEWVRDYLRYRLASRA